MMNSATTMHMEKAAALSPVAAYTSSFADPKKYQLNLIGS